MGEGGRGQTARQLENSFKSEGPLRAPLFFISSRFLPFSFSFKKRECIKETERGDTQRHSWPRALCGVFFFLLSDVFYNIILYNYLQDVLVVKKREEV